MAAIARVGDSISHGGSIVEGSPTVNANGIPIARIGDAVICNRHGAQAIKTGSGTVFANKIGVARIGDTCTCGAVIVDGSPNVYAGG